jgi:hypothetical protein
VTRETERYHHDDFATRDRQAGRRPANHQPSALPRRRILKFAAGAVFAACATAIAIARTRGYAPAQSQGRARTLTWLSPWQFVVVQHAARRITAPDREGDSSIPTADDLDVASFVENWTLRMPARVRRDLGRFLAYLEHLAPFGAGHFARFTSLSPQAQDSVLASVETSSSDLLRAGFDGLRSLIFLGYYQAPSTWRLVGYDGPLVGRPPSGWR